MQKSYLSSFHNDPRLTRYPNDKKIQPLFKKSFGQAEETLKKHIEEDSIHQADLNNRPSNISSKIKIRNISNPKTGSALNRENLEYLINKLKSEKLEVFRDLFTYTDKYDHRLCTRARLSEMKSLCENLLEMSKIAAERLNIENDLFGYLQMGTLTLSQEKLLCEDSEEEEGDNEEFYQKLVGISGVACVCLVKFIESGNLKISIYPYLSNQAIAVDLDVNSQDQDSEDLLSRSILPFLTFTSFTNGIGLKHLEGTHGAYKFYLNLKMINSPTEVGISVQEQNIEITCNGLTLLIQDLYLLDLLLRDNLLQAAFCLTENLFCFLASEPGLVWKAKPWEIERFEKKEEKVLARLSEVQEIPGKFDDFYCFCFEDLVHEVRVQVWRNLVSGKIKICFRSQEKVIEVKEEIYQEEFLLLFSFQDIDVRYARNTMLKSIEFKFFMNKFVDFYTQNED